MIKRILRIVVVFVKFFRIKVYVKLFSTIALAIEWSCIIFGILNRFHYFEQPEKLVKCNISEFIHGEWEVKRFVLFFVSFCHLPHFFEVVVWSPYLLVYPWVLLHVWVVCYFGVIFGWEDELVECDEGEPNESEEKYDKYEYFAYFLWWYFVLLHEPYLILLSFSLILILFLNLLRRGLLFFFLIFLLTDFLYYFDIIFFALVHGYWL